MDERCIVCEQMRLKLPVHYQRLSLRWITSPELEQARLAAGISQHKLAEAATRCGMRNFRQGDINKLEDPVRTGIIIDPDTIEALTSAEF